jgi:hypothetical protein
MSALNRTDFKALTFLKHSAFVRIDGAWRFGLTRVGDTVVDRLIAKGRVTHLFPGEPCECIIRKVP